jgi:hypothetical protein
MHPSKYLSPLSNCVACSRGLFVLLLFSETVHKGHRHLQRALGAGLCIAEFARRASSVLPPFFCSACSPGEERAWLSIFLFFCFKHPPLPRRSLSLRGLFGQASFERVSVSSSTKEPNALSRRQSANAFFSAVVAFAFESRGSADVVNLLGTIPQSHPTTTFPVPPTASRLRPPDAQGSRPSLAFCWPVAGAFPTLDIEG